MRYIMRSHELQEKQVTKACIVILWLLRVHGSIAWKMGHKKDGDIHITNVFIFSSIHITNIHDYTCSLVQLQQENMNYVRYIFNLII